MDATSVIAHLGAARCAVQVGDWAAATSWAARAVESAPRSVEPRLVLARAYLGAKQKPKAKAVLQSLLADFPNQGEARSLLDSL
jgi:uncharacterized protein HemY